MDNTDIEILKQLKKNSRIRENKLAQLIHMTPPSVSARIKQLEDKNVIKKYTIEVDPSKLGYTHQVFIETEMTHLSHKRYLEFIQSKQQFILHHYRISGQMNYMIQGGFPSNEELNNFLELLNEYANYKVLHIISELI
ncbi:Lrp/AsnC family transcriptional regulator [Paenibacillus sp. FSL F4-0122]|uniref:Lrp/AsnC family transcriptional regulator n=1 Tax=Paenibacillus TaxID=44249 RepID=UPI00096EE0DE|nr:Lrp/AsnC family transcriptional regulator [Paenibacillus odorifer]OME44187.1 winged helix-turn-helix domain-containing protein [Paenibacillus odorifer]OZQ77378.1 winged helix-turn-helix domain-containing protein [Paenibacillus odorifer]